MVDVERLSFDLATHMDSQNQAKVRKGLARMSISNSQRVITQVLDDCTEAIARFFLKNYAIDVKPASGANFFRKLAQVSRIKQQGQGIE